MTVTVSVEDFKQVGTAARQHGSVRQHLVSTHLYVKDKQEAHVLVRILCNYLCIFTIHRPTQVSATVQINFSNQQSAAESIISLKVDLIWVFFSMHFSEKWASKISHLPVSEARAPHGLTPRHPRGAGHRYLEADVTELTTLP